MEALGLILARGGSKGIPRKNLVDLGGEPLIAWTIGAALASDLTRVVVSTDDGEIAETARKYGAEVPFMRPARLATDDARSVDAEEHALMMLEARDGYVPDALFRLQPTSPFREMEDINCALRIAAQSHNPVLGISPARDTPSLLCDRIGAVLNVDMDERPRQQQGDVWKINGAVYASLLSEWRAHGWYDGALSYEMPYPHGWDIDTPFDLEVVRALVETGRV